MSCSAADRPPAAALFLSKYPVVERYFAIGTTCDRIAHIPMAAGRRPFLCARKEDTLAGFSVFSPAAAGGAGGVFRAEPAGAVVVHGAGSICVSYIGASDPGKGLPGAAADAPYPRVLGAAGPARGRIHPHLSLGEYPGAGPSGGYPTGLPHGVPAARGAGTGRVGGVAGDRPGLQGGHTGQRNSRRGNCAHSDGRHPVGGRYPAAVFAPVPGGGGQAPQSAPFGGAGVHVALAAAAHPVPDSGRSAAAYGQSGGAGPLSPGAAGADRRHVDLCAHYAGAGQPGL